MSLQDDYKNAMEMGYYDKAESILNKLEILKMAFSKNSPKNIVRRTVLEKRAKELRINK